MKPTRKLSNESASGGGTSAGNVASGPGAMRRRKGIAPNALDNTTTSIFGGPTVKRSKIKEGIAEIAGSADADHEVQMARAELYNIAKYAIELHGLLKNVSEAEGLEGWVQSKITKAADYINSVYNHISAQMAEAHSSSVIPVIMTPESRGPDSYKDSLHEKLEEKAKSKKQQRFMGMVYATKKGKKPASKAVAKVAKGMSTKSAKDYAATKHKGLSAHAKKKKIESLDLQAKRILGEGRNYRVYLQLNEAPIGDVVKRINASIPKLAGPVAKKAMQAVRSLPRTALPLMATVLMSLAAQGASAQTTDIQAQLNKLDQTIAQIGTVGNGGISQSTQNTINNVGSDINKTFNSTLDNLPGAGTAKSSGSWEADLDARADQIEKDFAAKNAKIDANAKTTAAADKAAAMAKAGVAAPQFTDYKSATAYLGGGTPPTIQALLKGNADFKTIKNMLNQYKASDPYVIAGALLTLEPSGGKDLAALKAYLSDPHKNPVSKQK